MIRDGGNHYQEAISRGRSSLRRVYVERARPRVRTATATDQQADGQRDEPTDRKKADQRTFPAGYGRRRSPRASRVKIPVDCFPLSWGLFHNKIKKNRDSVFLSNNLPHEKDMPDALAGPTSV